MLSPEQQRGRRNAYLKRIYGITIEQYEDLLQSQGGGCALCSKTPEKEGKSLAVDHNHRSGEVRGLLCSYCNHRIIGKHRDPDLLVRMARYVSQGTGWYVPTEKPKKKKRIGKR